MKAPWTWVPMWLGAVCAAAFGALVVAYISLPPPTHDGSYLGPVVVSGLLAIIFLGASRIEEHDDTLAVKERELEEKIKAVQARREKLRRLA